MMELFGKNVMLLVEESNKSSGALVAPEKYSIKPHKGRVVAIGNGVDKTKINLGDIVYFKYFMGIELKNEEEIDNTYIIIEQGCLLGKEIADDKPEGN